ncbi:uncharacterized protein N7511_003705 [Penicillium nucicola]|uniref:uncharacterized protein n=1 Tax=Penicillium nucicola TaxID=1850975 RepID=UPI00254546B5|nr:uncharacterized protein N7511_003705 [Penicillium nucicola]KAJ5766089.1 hypothetical protein N7511_003705 [Penicillium nucicola]
MPHGKPEHWEAVLINVPIVCTGVATACYALRLFSRYLLDHKLRIEDGMMGAGVICTWGVAICIVYSAVHGVGTGESIWDLPREQRLRIALSNWILQKFWPVAQVFVKVSILIFLRRLLSVVDWARHAATALMVFVVAWGVAAFIANTFQCWPVQYFWIKSIKGSCISGQTTLYTIIGAFSVVEDVLILALPLPIVWNLQMRLRDKIQLTFLFLMGCLVFVFSILRLLQLKNYLTDNLTYSSGLSLIWAILELDMAIICGSLMMLKPLFQSCMGTLRKGANRLSSGSYSFDSRGPVRSSRASRESDGFGYGRTEMLTTPTAARVGPGTTYNANCSEDWTMFEDIPSYDLDSNPDPLKRKSTAV